MKNIFTTLLSLLILSTFAQVEQKKNQNLIISSKIPDDSYAKPNPTVSLEKKENLKPNRIVGKSNKGVRSLAIPIKATRINETLIKNEIVINVDKNKSDLDNALSLIEEKENVNKYNPNLKASSKYQELLIQISVYKNKFNDSVNKKGIENCSIREQNYFLAFLKEDGKEDEYKSSISKIK